MTAVASPPSFANINRPAWGLNGGQSLNSMNSDDVRGVLMPRKTIPRNNSSSSISSNSSVSSSSTAVSSSNGQTNGPTAQLAVGELGGWPNAAPRKRPQGKGQWNGPRLEGGAELGRMPAGRPQMSNGLNGASSMSPAPLLQNSAQMAPQRPLAEPLTPGQPVLYLLSLNGTFERKTIQVPFYPETLRVGRQTNNKTIPTPLNGFFDSKVLSRQHAEIWADREGKIWIRDVKSSNGTFVNGSRLSPENRESEPHELSTSDHLELGIDIVSEDQKSVVHHKVAAKVEHAGFPPPSGLGEIPFDDLNPGNGPMIPQVGSMPRRPSAQGSVGPNGRGLAGAAAQMMNAQANGMAFNNRTFMNNHPSAEIIVKKLRNEMRNARQQAQDLSRTNKFLDALLSHEEIKNQDKLEAPEAPKAAAVNGNSLSFRPDAKTRFSDPPAPPPQQPLPEKPDASKAQGDVPSLKRATTERPKNGPPTTSPVRQDNLSQIIQLTEALNTAKREIDNQTVKMRDLEESLQREKEAREAAEQLAKRLEGDALQRMNGNANSYNEDKQVLEEAFDPSSDHSPVASKSAEETVQEPSEAEDRTKLLQSQIDHMLSEMKELREQVDVYKKQAEQASSERDADRKTLAEMVRQIRQRDEETAALKAAALARTRSASNGRDRSSTITADRDHSRGRPAASSRGDVGPSRISEDLLNGDDKPTLSRANTITPTPRSPSKRAVSDQAIMTSLPYASMIGVVLIGVGLMAYINGWQPQPRIPDR